MNPINRRTFIKGTLAGGVIAVAAAAGLLTPTRVLAAAWPAGAFEANNIDDAVKNLFGGGAASDSKAVTIKAPIQAEDGATVPITVSTSLPGVEGMAILVQANARPLIANVAVSGADSFFSARMKMSKTSDVKVVVKSQGKLYVATQNIKVTAGGC